MLATYEDFIKQNQNCKKFENDDVMQDIFYFLSREYVLTQLIDASEAGRPAITPVVENVEHFFMDTRREYTHTLDDNFTKQAIGLMVKTILEPFGYVVWKQKDLPKKSGATKFTSASAYKFSHLAPRTMRVVKRIVEIDFPVSRQDMRRDGNDL